jgi:hypothetical protein
MHQHSNGGGDPKRLGGVTFDESVNRPAQKAAMLGYFGLDVDARQVDDSIPLGSFGSREEWRDSKRIEAARCEIFPEHGQVYRLAFLLPSDG